MTTKFFTLVTFALAAAASPVLVVRDDAPKPAKTGLGGFGGRGSSGSSASSGSSSGGLSSFAGLDCKTPARSMYFFISLLTSSLSTQQFGLNVRF